ncbi:MAG TPA: gluconate 2-dehydrogenase subunit 3 family protein [Opitutus sp.]|nr:gluconate 2-dehydrogenase subunit 3 family protein [Opitutus sp.]
MEMTRRQAVIKMAFAMGASVIGPRLLAAQFGGEPGLPASFSEEERALLDEIGETIIPATDVPGAKAVGIGAFIATMVQDCYPSEVQAAVRNGLSKIASLHEARFGVSFMSGAAKDRTELLNELDREQKAAHARGGPLHYFRVLKELTILGYFTSKIGCTQALRFVEVPGSYDGDAPYRKGEKAWF